MTLAPATAPILVIGYGNTLRRDDALGCLIADELERRRLPGIRSLSLPQLTPDLAVAIAAAPTVIFVDARPFLPGTSMAVKIEPLLPAVGHWPALDHALTPGRLLCLADVLFGRCPPAWQVSVPGWDFSFGEGLSDRARHEAEQAPGMIMSLIAREYGFEPDRACRCPTTSLSDLHPATEELEHEPTHHPG